MHVWALWLSCKTPPASGPPGLHTTARELQTRTFERPGASNTTKIPREDPQRESKINFRRDREKKARNFGPPTLRPPTFRAPTPTTNTPPPHQKKLAKCGLAKFGQKNDQMRPNKDGQMRPVKFGQMRFGKMRPSKDGQIRFGQMRSRPFCCCLQDSIEFITKDVTLQCPHWSSTAFSTTALISWCRPFKSLRVTTLGSSECDFFQNWCINIEDAIEAVTHGQLCVPRPHTSVKQGNVHD